MMLLSMELMHYIVVEIALNGGIHNMKDGFYSVKLVDGAKWYLDDLPTDSDFLATFGEEEE